MDFPSVYHMLSSCCIKRLTKAIPIQQHSPMNMGFPPVLINLTMLVFRPIAPMAIIMKNLLKSFKGVVTDEGSDNTVVNTEASTKKRIKIGKTFVKLIPLLCTVLPPESIFFLSFCTLINPRTNVIGMMARVLVNLTVTAVSKVLEPSP